MRDRTPVAVGLGLGLAVLVLAGLAAWTLTATPEQADPATAERAPERELDGSTHRAAKPQRSPRAERVDPAEDDARSSEQQAQRRQQTRRLLQHKYGRAQAPSGSPDDGSELAPLDESATPPVLPPSSWSSLPEDYVKGVLEDQLVPVAKGCYEDIAAPGTSGELTFSLAVIGDAEVGGIIDTVDLQADESSIEGELSECIRQASYALEFAPPEAGQGVAEFDFTMRFDSDEEPG